MSKFKRFPNEILWDSQLVKVGGGVDSDIKSMQKLALKFLDVQNVNREAFTRSCLV